ncbi:MAG: hypothetical protein QM811_03320, partial [Pirellulales bacterium]
MIFRPGDPLTKTVEFQVREMKAGNTAKAVQQEEPDGRQTQRRPDRNHRRRRRQERTDHGRSRRAQVRALGQTRVRRDRRDDQVRRSRRLENVFHFAATWCTQVGNGETGYYGTVEMGGFARTDEGLTLTSRRLEKPIKVGSPALEYPFLAVMLSGHKT